MRIHIFYALILLSRSLYGTTETPWVDPKDLKDYPGLITNAVIESYFEELVPIKNEAKTSIEKSPYRLHIGDSFTISLYGEPDSVRNVRVDSTGSMTYLFLNNIHAVGKTIEEIREEFTQQLRSHYKYPLVAINPKQLYGKTYTIFGQVHCPGNKKIVGDATVLTAICESGGFDKVDLDHAFLARNKELYPIDFNKLVKGDLTQDVKLEDGDYIFFPAYKKSILDSNHSLSYVNATTLTEALKEKGNFMENSQVLILRGTLTAPQSFLVDVNLIKKGQALDFSLQQGDIIYIPPREITSLKEISKMAITSWVSQAMNR